MKVKISLIKTIAGSYGMHGQSGWDDLPYWEYYKAFIVRVIIDGYYCWGPFKLRKNAKKEHSGNSTVRFEKGYAFVATDTEDDEKEIGLLLKEAEDKMLEVGSYLEDKGFQVEMFFGENDGGRKDLDIEKMTWITNPPPEKLITKARHGIGLDNLCPSI